VQVDFLADPTPDASLADAEAARGLARISVKVTGLAQKLGQLEAVHRNFQSKYWANLKLLGPTL
jgi:hypothetical protein